MLFGKTLQEAQYLLSLWRNRIEEGNLYGFGLSRRIYALTPLPQPLCLPLNGVYDNNPALHGQTVLGYKIIDPQEVTQCSGGIIVFPHYYETFPIYKQLEDQGLKPLRDFIDADSFWTMFAYYKYNLIMPYQSLSVFPTLKCVLRCKNCQLKVPYIKNNGSRPLDDLKRDIKDLFGLADLVTAFGLAGGEIFMYDHDDLAVLLKYTWGKFGHKMRSRLHLTPTGLIPPGQNLLKAIGSVKPSIGISDYSGCGLPDYQQKLNLTLSLIKKAGVNFQREHVDQWFIPHLLPQTADLLRNYGSQELRAHYAACRPYCMTYEDGRFFHCGKSYANEKLTGIRDKGTTDVKGWSLSNLKDRERLLMCYLGYNQQGYMDFCRQCPGKTFNQWNVPPAEQLPSGYDKSNPLIETGGRELGSAPFLKRRTPGHGNQA